MSREGLRAGVAGTLHLTCSSLTDLHRGATVESKTALAPTDIPARGRGRTVIARRLMHACATALLCLFASCSIARVLGSSPGPSASFEVTQQLDNAQGRSIPAISSANLVALSGALGVLALIALRTRRIRTRV